MNNQTLAYPARFRPEPEGGFSISFPDFPEAHSQGDSRAEAYEMASDCLYTAIEWRIQRKAAIPAPSASKRGQVLIAVPLEVAPKLALYQAMRERGVNNSALARDLRVSENAVRRMLDPGHKSTAEQYTRALYALGRAIETTVVNVR